MAGNQYKCKLFSSSRVHLKTIYDLQSLGSPRGLHECNTHRNLPLRAVQRNHKHPHGASFILLRPIFLSEKYSIYEILMERLAILALAYCFKNPGVYFYIFNNPCHWKTRVQRDLSPMVKVTRSIQNKLPQWPTFT